MLGADVAVSGIVSLPARTDCPLNCSNQYLVKPYFWFASATSTDGAKVYSYVKPKDNLSKHESIVLAFSQFANCDHSTPAAMAEPRTPATLGAMACINK